MADREKLIEILRVPIYPHLDADPAEVVADYLLDNGVTFATDNNVGDKMTPTDKDNNVPSNDVPDTNVGKWIPVTERLPSESGKYLVCTKTRNVYQIKFYTYPPEGGHWGQKDKGRSITHWMHLPEAPKGE